ncbi:hypothetical protein BKC00_02595 [Chlamydia trachomatis]|uniref:toxin-antitoxin system YwqK family antitoxin n=1 Tax=Chlamydia trachomatis TaxID=813 RepID=UPI00061DA67B|nr:toxin-antitoxin system YwqK family antitoxin [Chlamydia trachomatis]ATW20194.1 hypothetical protein BKC00_02595 [Chlamydia trachomatis]ATW21106.1 hypothetical protein BKC01_02595 [Chlamydia trachomatis]CRH47735.1 putative membrane associated protein [Chlamydia trachomatis]CRH57315.1 putative membrane associated protein [Chlamydia trachomatis]
MKRLFFICALALSPLAYGAVQKDPMLMKETFRNNYGIIVSKQEWNKRGCDGSITRVFKDGTTTLEVYAQGALHGEITRTFPHSTTLAVIETYDQGRLLSKKTFFPNALPAKEEVYHEDGSFSLTRWPDNNNSDTITDPCFVEKTYGGRVLEGHYTSFNGKYSSTILNGEGVRSTFSSDSILLTEESFNDGVMVKKTTFYSTREPETVTHYVNGYPHGVRFTYLPGGIPNTIEEWRYGHQDGLTILFKNGCKIAEVPFVRGAKNGIELRYNEQENIAEEISWQHNILHGVRKIHAAGVCKSEWYYKGKPVSQIKFERLSAAR